MAAIELPPGQWERAWVSLRRRDVLGRIGLALAAALAVCWLIQAGDPPFRWRRGFVLNRNISARTAFSREDVDGTRLARDRARREVRWVFENDSQPLIQLRASLRNTISELIKAEQLTEANRGIWNEFQPAAVEGASKSAVQADEPHFQQFRKALAGKENFDRLDRAVADAFAPLEKYGLLDKLPEGLQKGDGNQEEIVVFPSDKPTLQEIAKLSDVLIGNGAAMQQTLQQGLKEHVKAKELADRLYGWLQPRLAKVPPTLKWNQAETEKAQNAAVKAAPLEMKKYTDREVLVNVGEMLDAPKIELLKLEYEFYLTKRTLAERTVRGAAVLAVIFAMFVLCGIHMRYRQRGPLASVGRLVVLLLMAVGTIAVAVIFSNDPWRAELVPLLLFGMTISIVYRQELAMLLSGVLAWIIVLALGHGLPEFLLLFGAVTAGALSLGQIRSRSKLIYVGLFAGGVASLLTIAMGIIENQPLVFHSPAPGHAMSFPLLENAARNGMWAVAAGFLMTGLLPFIEQTFGVLTDLSLLELGDVTHPLLQELVRRAPSTYNHSITVGSIGEAAAESIGARGLLVRVGAYFHDIGKMLKPGYFVENQGSEGSRHETLVPAMSTLVIIAHIKDGSDLARQHRLPQPITDLIAQHHGTTLVEYFYDRAQHQQTGSDPNGGEVDENLFRYPGPKPQTKEAAVLMLADAVESASRALVDPTPARIESLVRALAERRLHGGQFDESGLTLRELRAIERSLVMSLTAIYHGRLKYPEPHEKESREQKTA